MLSAGNIAKISLPHPGTALRSRWLQGHAQIPLNKFITEACIVEFDQSGAEDVSQG